MDFCDEIVENTKKSKNQTDNNMKWKEDVFIAPSHFNKAIKGSE